MRILFRILNIFNITGMWLINSDNLYKKFFDFTIKYLSSHIILFYFKQYKIIFNEYILNSCLIDILYIESNYQ